MFDVRRWLAQTEISPLRFASAFAKAPADMPVEMTKKR